MSGIMAGCVSKYGWLCQEVRWVVLGSRVGCVRNYGGLCQ